MRALIFTLLIYNFLHSFSQAEPDVWIPYTAKTPVVDGVEESAWDLATKQAIFNNFQEEVATVSGYWKALWDNNYLYVLINIQDDDHWPAWVSQGNWWEYDQIEVYFDINSTLVDGLGPNDKGTGHYQAVPRFLEGQSGVLQTMEASNYRPGGNAAYALTGENYVFELALDYTSFVNKDGQTMSKDAFKALNLIGFDITIVDQDENLTTSRQRKVWYNTGNTDESFVNMDDVGTIKLVDELPKKIINSSGFTSEFNIYPNPASDKLAINFGQVSGGLYQIEFYSIDGQQRRSISYENKSGNTPFEIYLNEFSNGLYLIHVSGEGVNYSQRISVSK